MKKVCAVLGVLLLGVAAFAESGNWQSYIGAGVTVPVYQHKVKDDGSRTLFGALADIGVFGVNTNNGFTFKADFAAGWGTTADIPLYDDSRKHGFASNIEGGIGYSFIRSSDTVLSVLGTFGAGSYSFEGSKSITYGSDNLKLSDSDVVGYGFGLGAEVSLIKRLGEKLHLFANVGARYVIDGYETTEYSGDHDDIEYAVSFKRSTDGGFAVTPTIGLYWSL